MKTINERMTEAMEPEKPYTLAHELYWAADKIAAQEAEIDRLGAIIDRIGDIAAGNIKQESETGLHSHGWRNGPRYHEEGYDVGDGDDCGDSGLSVGMQAETGYTPETVEQRLRRKDFLYLAKVERNE